MHAARFPAHARLAAGVSVFLLLTACVAPQTGRLLQEHPGRLPASIELTDVPYHPQPAFQCGPATLSMTLGWSGLDIPPATLAPEVFIPKKQGSLQPEMVATVRRHGRLAYLLEPKLNDLLAEVAAGHPVIVLQNLGLSWIPIWHYAVVIGYDLDKRIIILHSGPERRHLTKLSTFERTWSRSNYWALLVLPPDTLPATAEEQKVLDSAVALEQTGQLQPAATAYRTMLRRWPGNAAARIGLGNCLYAEGRLAEAEAAFYKVSQEHPDSAIAFNNLAQTYADEGKLDAAFAAARKAVELGGPLVGTFRQTLREIQSKQTGRKQPVTE